MKECNKCKTVKPLSNYYKNANMKDGFGNVCKECTKEYQLKRYHTLDLKEEQRKRKEYYINNPKALKKKQLKDKEWKKSSKAKASDAAWKKKNAFRYVAWASARRARKYNALASWYEFEKQTIEAFYKEAKELTEKTGIKYSVDHIVPFKHNKVCGLHCSANLQVITLSENDKKWNYFEV